jgi:hypothetical protein
VLIGTAWTINAILTKTQEALWGLGIVGAGIPFYIYWRSKNREHLRRQQGA